MGPSQECIHIKSRKKTPLNSSNRKQISDCLGWCWGVQQGRISNECKKTLGLIYIHYPNYIDIQIYKNRFKCVHFTVCQLYLNEDVKTFFLMFLDNLSSTYMREYIVTVHTVKKSDKFYRDSVTSSSEFFLLLLIYFPFLLHFVLKDEIQLVRLNVSFLLFISNFVIGIN